ncbi:hypothetical protein Tco_0692648 [Tanacetum coccineum]
MDSSARSFAIEEVGSSEVDTSGGASLSSMMIVDDEGRGGERGIVSGMVVVREKQFCFLFPSDPSLIPQVQKKNTSYHQVKKCYSLETDIQEKDEKSSKNGQNRARNGKRGKAKDKSKPKTNRSQSQPGKVNDQNQSRHRRILNGPTCTH